MQPYFQNFGFKQGDFPNSEAYYESALTLPLFSSMTSEQQDEVVTVLKNILQ
jgi:dTDP-4-amino-4,6-dideoxygalactose transaminase